MATSTPHPHPLSSSLVPPPTPSLSNPCLQELHNLLFTSRLGEYEKSAVINGIRKNF